MNLRIAILAEKPISADRSEADGFQFRYWYFSDQLAQTDQVNVFYLQRGAHDAYGIEDADGGSVVRVPMPPGGWVRANAWRAVSACTNLVRPQRRQSWEKELLSAVDAYAPDVVLAF